jgi:2-dehydro-3-deoxyphosphogluconate aldolase/(4S)-4-hydroxy-2-oxoglutarate aldolase
MSKSDVLNRIKSEKVIALIRADSSASLLDCARALAAGGLSCIELTMTTPNAIECCAQVAKELPNVLLGLGTVLDAETAKRGIAAGAAILSGALTPTEACNAWDAGADVIKIFPAEFFGPAYIKSLKAPFPNLQFLPTGGVTPETVGDFLKAGAFATAAGSALVAPAALKSGAWAAITARAKQFVAAANAAKA